MDCRIFVEKKSGFNLEAKRLATELKESLKLNTEFEVKILNTYDIFNIEKSELEKAKKNILSEVVTDDVYDSLPSDIQTYFSVEYLPGQFDQRADSAMQCLNLISHKNLNVVVTSGKVIGLKGNITKKDFEKIKKYYINPVEMREKNLEKLEIEEGEIVQDIPVYEDFIYYDNNRLKNFRETLSLTMTLEDLKFVQTYFKDIEKRNPTETEIKVLDTFWSDHCRHTTFETKIKNIIFPEDIFGKILKESYDEYLSLRNTLYGEKATSKKISLMDMATVYGKYLRKVGKLSDLEVSDEINACSIYIDVDIDGQIEKWLLMFKNETHNHPTEIDPFGGASTCIGGAIRDPLSGRAYVYQAIRVTGASNPLENIDDTLVGKLPQKKIITGAAAGYSSYGNQIGLATGHVSEIYHEGYKAKRMEVGAVVGAVPVTWVKREKPISGDIVMLLGGKTGRDGCGGATGSSKKHTIDSLNNCGAEVQKGNAPEERKIQRLFRNPDVTKLIKKCNDFGAGGISVAIGELASGLKINLDKIKTKYKGLSGTELAISESQERMAVLIAKKDREKFIELADKENLEATEVATVTDKNRITMFWREKKIVDLSQEFLNTNGITQEVNVYVENINFADNILKNNKFQGNNLREKLENMLSSLNICSQKGLIERFDSTIGSSTVLMPFGGKYQLTPTDVSVQKIPILHGETDTASAIAWGYNPYIFSWSQYHGAMYSIVESLSKIVAIGGDYKKIRLSFQEYFKKLGNDSKNWGQPFSALLGTIIAQKKFEVPAIGGKDSMSGTFNDIHVPPTLISFAVGTVKASEVISPELKNPKNKLYLIKHQMKNDLTPNFEQLKENFNFIHKNIINKTIISAQTLKCGGIAEAIIKMCFGNHLGAKIKDLKDDIFSLSYGSILVESTKELEGKNVEFLGEVTDSYILEIGGERIKIDELEKIWLEKLSSVFPYKIEDKKKNYIWQPYNSKEILICKNKIAEPRVLIPVFPGTNCEYDSARVFDKAGGKSNIVVFNNLSQIGIDESIDKLVKEINNSQILMFSGGFSAGDEPDGAGKFIATVLINPKIKESIEKFLQRDGLILGICNGFQALIKSGLLPYGKLGEITKDNPTLTFNKIGRHISQIVKTKVVSNKSPWLANIAVGEEFEIPVSHGEGRFFASDKVIKQLFLNGQVATQYVDFSGIPTDEFKFNPNGSSYAIEGITSFDGKIFGKMGHSERIGNNIIKNILGNKEQKIFENGVKYFK